jgi:hypothetical protein
MTHRMPEMKWNRIKYGVVGVVLSLIIFLSAEPESVVRANELAANMPQSQAAQPQQDSGLIIVNDSPLPNANPMGTYEVHLSARGGVGPLRWRLEKGPLPPGMQLETNGLLHGAARSGGEFQFTVSVHDSGNQHAQKDFVLVVRSALELKWKSLAHVGGNRIDGSVEVSNATGNDMDLTFIVLAVAPNGRATAIGYQHFTLRKGISGQELPFGDTIARGSYVVYVDVVGEVAPKNLIYREQLQSHALQVTAGL